MEFIAETIYWERNCGGNDVTTGVEQSVGKESLLTLPPGTSGGRC